MFYDDNIKLRQVNLDEFQKGILSGEIKPHDVDIVIRYKDGKEKKANIKWDMIVGFYKHHNLSAVDQMYQYTEGYSSWVL